MQLCLYGLETIDGTSFCTGYSCQQCSIYYSAKNYRGNETRIRTFSDAANLAGAIDNYKQYDITGNVVVQNTACCQQMNVTYHQNFAYAYPTTQTRGPAMATPDPNASNTVATHAWYDWNTGLQITAIDAHGLTSTFEYHPYTLRIERENSPTGAYTTYIYDDASMFVVNKVHDSNNAITSMSVPISERTWKSSLPGRRRLKRQFGKAC